MACGMKLLLVAIALSLVLNTQHFVQGKPQVREPQVEEPQVPCFFIFGDSVSDNGNNNLLPTFAKVNYSPYGVDFPQGPTGRFCNGRNIVDVLAELLGFENYIPPFAYANGSEIVKGVNYASGAAGIRKESGSQLGACISMGEQLKNHRTTVLRIIDILGKRSLAKKHLNKCLYSVGMGSNDYINNYFLPQYYQTSQKYTLEEYAEVLIKQYTQQILRLRKYGARKVSLVGLGLIGCTPDAIKTYGTNGSSCVEKLNNASQQFNQKLVALVDELNTNFTDSKFIYVNSYEMGSGDPTLVGFKVLDAGCCEVDEYGQCAPNKTPCQNRTDYVFWDGFHPSEASNLITASRTYSAYNASDTYPMDISHLVQLQLEPQVTAI
ncbi:GDSL esterase/lipase At1g29660-like [Prunus avium]|uniref:GDSL esterase/lipase At1g29660-like n=1 Tax=Prunus avium TaxID=42229 RepID=A0A6P5TEJ7_PRUAV|nr:GDSL esterase/lipase At1g29660-like [Prunus avium]